MAVRFEEYGSGEPVILIHAFPLSRKMWAPQVRAFAGENVRLIVPDLPGFGESPLPPAGLSLEDMARGVAGLIDELGIEKAVIGGLSMGGYVTFNLFRIRPDLFKAAVFCDTTSAADTEEKRVGRLATVEKIKDLGMQILIDEMLPNLIGEYTKANNDELVSELTQMFADIDPHGAIAAMRAMAERKDHTYLLPDIDVPTLFIVGDQDKLTDAGVAETMHSQVKGSEIAIIENAGHYTNLEQPEQFNDTLLSFCGSVFR